MTPCAVDVGEISPIELTKSARATTLRRLLPGVLDDFPGIAVRGESVIFPLISFLEADVLYDAVCRMAADLLEMTTNSPLATGSIILEALRIACPIMDLAKIELIFVIGPGGIRWTGRYIIYAAPRYYAAQFTLGERLLSGASYSYVYWVIDIDFICPLFAARIKPTILEIRARR